MASKDVSFGIRLEEDLARALEDAARESGRTRNELIAEVLRQAYGPRMGLNAILEAALAEADRAVRDRLAVVQTAIQQVQDRIATIEKALKDAEDELLDLETREGLDPVERAQRRAALKQDLAVFQEGLTGERQALEDLRAQRQTLLGKRAEVYAKNLRPALEDWVTQEGVRVAAALCGLFCAWISALDSVIELPSLASKARIVRYLWLAIASEIARTAPDEGVRVWARSQLPPTATDWSWARAVNLVFSDCRPRVPADHTEVGHDTEKQPA